MRPVHAARKRLAYGPRSPKWRQVREAHLRLEPACRACGGVDELQVHHKQPFHLHPELELDQSNLITLCEKRGHDCHFHFGHYFNWRWFNPDVVKNAAAFAEGRKEAKARADLQEVQETQAA